MRYHATQDSEQALLEHGEREYMAEYNAHKHEIFESLGGHLFQEIHRSDVEL